MIAIGSDHGGYELKEQIKAFLDEKDLAYKDFGTHSTDSCDYADIAEVTCDAVVRGECDKAILICGTGIGISMAANKINGIRAAACSDYFSAKYTRLHNEACSVHSWEMGSTSTLRRYSRAFCSSPLISTV